MKTTVEGFVVEFVVDVYQSFSKAKKELKRAARMRLVKEIPTWINMLLVEEGILPFQPINMAE